MRDGGTKLKCRRKARVDTKQWWLVLKRFKIEQKIKKNLSNDLNLI